MPDNRTILFIFIFIFNFYLIKSTTIINSNVLQEMPNYHNNENHTKSGLEPVEDIEALESKKALELYKLIMIFTCCILAILLVCFLICILRNSDVIPSTTSQLNLNDAHSSSDENSITTQTSNNLLLWSFEKPPSYSETLKQIHKEFGHPPPIYTINSQINNQNLINQQQQTQQQQVNQDELILDCNSLIRVNDERSNLELIIANQNREQLRRLSRDLERFHLPNPLNRSHSTPVICLPPISRNILFTKNQHLINLMQSPSTVNLINTNSQANNTTDFNVIVDLDELNQLNNLDNEIINNQIINHLNTLQQTNLEQNNSNNELV